MFVFLIWCERHGQGSIIDVHELTLFFTTFVMLQFWNLFNAKSLGSAYSASVTSGATAGLCSCLR